MIIEDPLVSIVIPVYNGSNYLSEAIDSALAQTYPNCEVLVVNDGSNDQGATAEIARSYGGRVRYFEKENGGVATALNLGIRQMEGEYFAWLSHDDLYKPEKIEKQIRAVLACGDRARLVLSEYEFYQMPAGCRTATEFSQLYEREQLEQSVFSPLWLWYHACGVLIHKSHFDRVGVFDETYRAVQDTEMLFRVFRRQRVIFVPEVLHSVRIHEQADTITNSSCLSRECGRFYQYMVERLSVPELKEVFGSPCVFWCRIAGILKSHKCWQELKYIGQLLEQYDEWDEDPDVIIGLHQYLYGCCENRRRKIAIFGAGQYGVRIKFELECRLIHPDLFVDNAPSKWGTVIDGIPCISMEEACRRKEELFIVIALRTLTPALSQVKELEFPYYTTKQRLEAKLLRIPPVMSQREKWLKLL